MARTLEQFDIDLRGAADGGIVDVIRKALIPLSYKTEAAAKRNATTAPKVVTGALRGSIRGRVRVEGSKVLMEQGASVVYAPIQEYGGTILTRKGTSYSIRANRFLGKAMDAATTEAKSTITAAIKAYLQQGPANG